MIIIELNGNISEDEKSFLSENDITFSASKSLFGGPEITEIMIVSLPIVLGGFFKILSDKIKENRTITVKYFENGKPQEISVKNFEDFEKIKLMLESKDNE